MMELCLFGNRLANELGKLMRMSAPLTLELKLTAPAPSSTGIGARGNDRGARSHTPATAIK